MIQMQKESPKRGWQLRSTEIFSLLLVTSRCKKNHPKGDGNLLSNTPGSISSIKRCKKNHPKGDGNIYVDNNVFNDSKGKMQKESPKRGWQPLVIRRIVKLLGFLPMQEESPKRGWQQRDKYKRKKEI